jgi:hypothetical protein
LKGEAAPARADGALKRHSEDAPNRPTDGAPSERAGGAPKKEREGTPGKKGPARHGEAQRDVEKACSWPGARVLRGKPAEPRSVSGERLVGAMLSGRTIGRAAVLRGLMCRRTAMRPRYCALATEQDGRSFGPKIVGTPLPAGWRRIADGSRRDGALLQNCRGTRRRRWAEHVLAVSEGGGWSRTCRRLRGTSSWRWIGGVPSALVRTPHASGMDGRDEGSRGCRWTLQDRGGQGRSGLADQLRGTAAGTGPPIWHFSFSSPPGVMATSLAMVVVDAVWPGA